MHNADLVHCIEALEIHQTVPFHADNSLFELDLTASNPDLTTDIVSDQVLFTNWIAAQLHDRNATYGIGGYNEHRTIYSRSTHFGIGADEPRRLHLGTDIWGPAGTPVAAFADATVHGFGFNGAYGDYGATIILKYDLGRCAIFALYGHLSKTSLADLFVGKKIGGGEVFAWFGNWEDNGHWPPHLHFQLITKLDAGVSDYPGVCKFSERDTWLQKSPDPMIILAQNFNL